MTEYGATTGMHSTVWGNKLLYGHVPDLFLLCGTGSSHAKLLNPGTACHQKCCVSCFS